MKKSLKTAISLLACVAVAAGTFAFAACADEQDPALEQPVVSYVSTDSTVYSSTAEVVSEVADTVVEISTEAVTTQWGMQYIVSGAGSGVIVARGSEDDSQYLIITNNHVIDGADDILVRTRSGAEYKAELVATDDAADIAVVSISSESRLKLATWGNSDDLQIGEDLIAIGNPLGSLGGTVTKGILSATERNILVGEHYMTLLQTDTAINPGNSGGGLFNMRGELIGVVNAKTSDEEVEGICFAIPANTAKDTFDDLVSHGYVVGRATFDITLSEGSISSGIGTSNTIAYVTALGENVEDGTFELYDRIYKINGVEISSIAEYNAALAQIKPGDEVTFEVFRGKLENHDIFGGTQISFESQSTTFTATALQYGA